MRIETCSFCSRPCYPSKGITFVRNDARMFRFCQSKCHKNFKMKRNPRKLKWTKSFRRAAGKEMTVDASLTFAARRNVPLRYNREQLATTVQAMERVAEIRARRERAFYKQRMAGNRAARRAADRALVETQGHLLPQERGSVRVAREAAVEQELIEGLAGLGTVERDRRARKEAARQRLLVGGGVEAVADEGMDED